MIKYLSLSQVLHIAEEVTGLPFETVKRVAQLHLIDSAIAVPQTQFIGLDPYPTLAEKAAVLAFLIVCWIFFFFSMASTSSLQSFAPSALLNIYEVPIAVGSYYITLLALGSAGGVLFGGYLAAKLKAPERIVTSCLSVTIVMCLLLGTGFIPAGLIPILFFGLGFGYGVVAPSRDLLVKTVTPKGVAGRVYGIVYSGIDLGAAVGPFIFGFFMDAGLPNALFLGIVAFQLMIIPTVFKVSAGIAQKTA